MAQHRNYSPSSTFLFDSARTGRSKYAVGESTTPKLIWKYNLPAFPPKAPESTPVFDHDGNLYFGAHDRCVYSLDPSGKLRWLWNLDNEKIYSSPALARGNSILIASGDGYLYRIGFDGSIKWRYHISKYKPGGNRWIKKLKKIIHAPKYFDPDRGKKWTVKCWSSPNVMSDNIVLITGFGLGLHAVAVKNGESVWKYDFGEPRYHLSGTAVNSEKEIFAASQQRNLFCFSENGKLKWHYDTRLPWDAWGNPSIDEENETVFFPISFRESKSKILALDYTGKLKWETILPGAVRGSIAVSYQDYVLAAGFNGVLYFLDKVTGKIVNKITLSKAHRALWTTPVIDPKGNILITTKDDPHNGSLTCISQSGEILWKYKTGKSLSTPVVDHRCRIYFGNWNGEFLCVAT